MITLKEFLTDKNIFQKNKSILLEGGQAAVKLISNLINNTGNKELQYVRATPTNDVLDEVNNLYNILVSNNFIDDEKPSYILGSSRLFAIAAGIKQPEPTEFEPIEVINKALKIKRTFGDIDLDVSFKQGVTPNIIKTFINNYDKSKYFGEVFGGEISIATVVDGTNNVIQIDIVNVKENKAFLQHTQFSSMADIAENIKGVIRDVLIRSIAKTHPIPQKQYNAIIKLIKSTEQYKHYITKNKDKNPDIDVRYSLGGDGLMLKIIWLKNGVESSNTIKGIKYEKLPEISEDPSVRSIGYNNDNLIADILGFDHPEYMKHVTLMVKAIAKMPTDRKQEIWDSMIDNLSTKLPIPGTSRSVGQISKDEATHAVNYMAKYFGKDVNTSSKNLTKIEEAVKMTSIPHFDQMTVPQIISFFDDTDWEVTEKADGTNVSFGLDENGIYVKSKKMNPVYDPQEFVDLSITFNTDIHLGFAELLKMLRNNYDKFVNFYKRHNMLVNNKGFQIFGELFSKSHMNVIAYSPEKIGRGALYIFMVKSDTADKGIDITNTTQGQKIINDFINEFQGVDGWNLYNRRPVETNILKSKYKDEIINIIKNNKDILTSRTKADKPQKEVLTNQLMKLLSALKKETIGQISKVPSMLGAEEIEGVIVRNLKNGSLAKIVDLEGFGARRVEQWAGTDRIKELRGILFDKIQNQILGNADIFVLPNKQLEKLTDELSVRGYKYQSIEDMLNVLYQDAVSERPDLKKNFNKILNNLIVILTKHINDVKQTINEVDTDNQKTYENTKNSIDTEVNNISQVLAKIQNIKNDADFYVEVIKFFIGFKGLNNLINTFLK